VGNVVTVFGTPVHLNGAEIANVNRLLENPNVSEEERELREFEAFKVFLQAADPLLPSSAISDNGNGKSHHNGKKHHKRPSKRTEVRRRPLFARG
jgi:hypothetical protein